MRIGAGLALVAVGAILRFAVTTHIDGIDLAAMGVILMIVGAVVMAFSLVLMSTRRRTEVIHQGPVYAPLHEPLHDEPLYDERYIPRPGLQPGIQTSRTTYIEPGLIEPGDRI